MQRGFVIRTARTMLLPAGLLLAGALIAEKTSLAVRLAQDPEEIPLRDDGSLKAESDPYRVDTQVLDIENFGFVEYKYRLEQGQTMVYAWQSSGPVRSEMHSQDDTAPPGTADFFEVLSEATEAQGTYTAPFTGIHGWYWENLNIAEPITVTITAAGFFSEAQEFRSEGIIDHAAEDIWSTVEVEGSLSEPPQ